MILKYWRWCNGFRPLAGCGLFPAGCPAKYTANGSFRPLAGCGLFPVGSKTDLERLRFRPLAGVGCFCDKRCEACQYPEFPSPCGVWVVSHNEKRKQFELLVSVPLRGVGCFERIYRCKNGVVEFPSPCGVWVVSEQWRKTMEITSFRPLAGCGLFLRCAHIDFRALGFRPLAGCGLFRQSCTFFLVQQEKELSTLLFYCIILADVYQ